MKILVAEDETAIRNNIVSLLRMEGFDVVEAPNGRIALALAREHLPELVLSDVMMPELDGLGLLELLRADPLTAGIPLIFLSARTERADRRKGMNLGADDYLGKPFSRDELLEAVSARLKRHQAAAKSDASLKTAPAATALANTKQRPPVTVKGYRILRKIGSGGMSEVFLAVRESDQRELALKVLDTAINDDGALLDRFLQEYALLAQIDHPNVARIFDQGITDAHAFLSMEYFVRGDIKQRIAAGLTQHEALGVTVQVALALAQIHARGIVHRDVKPDNLMMRRDGTVALIDFGIAKHADHAMGHTLHGEIVGSPFYLSPEQAAGRPVSAASDIYCLGVIFHEMLTGQRPYTADRMEVLLAQHLFSPPPRLAPQHSDMQDLLDRMMHKDPVQRMGTAQAVVKYITERWPLASSARI
ncbi:protein kinase [Rhodoferax sp. AJA081-3]|uniref:protein kinase domain-containing protein n=1 Tax=Rhodoferax sp. AJA081-3 TaxID=2752316 RepID=UPI001ADFD41F|nr:protein kinase [Rhodoferax sp. AJA081-3]QTN26500.1 protein kinase [Rhodoferax sp. AJA081-3]